MENSTPLSAGTANKRYRILSGSALKTIALLAMIIDHVGYLILSSASVGSTPLFTVGSFTVTLYWIFRKIGRIAFPIYAFLLSEGYLHSKNVFRYALDLLVFALIAEIPWNLAHSGNLFLLSSQNVFFTLFLGLLAVILSERFRAESSWKELVPLFLVFAVSYVLKADYGIRGVGFILLVHLLRERKAEQALIGSAVYINNAPAYLIAFLLINTYNGRRGFIRSKAVKYVYYAAYPVHLLILWLIRTRCFP